MSEQPEEGTKRKKRASLWEKSVVQAFRDLQWLLTADRWQTPEINVPFAGKIEAAFGDGIVSADEKLFLLEIKADEAGKSAEWEDEKLAYKSLEDAILNSNSEKPQAELDGWFELCMRSHLFLYWSAPGKGRDARLIPGELVVNSYLLDVAKLSPLNTREICQDLAIFSSIAVLKEGTDDTFIRKSQVLASRLFDSSAMLVREGSIEPTSISLGLTPGEMQGYVKWLASKQELRDLPINAVLASRNGAVCQHVSHVDDLEQLLTSLMAHQRLPRLPIIREAEPSLPRSEVRVTSVDRQGSSFGL